ncbi:MAG: biosynthetic-type acetolactate synthase large subunit [Lachnospiraceae bacterium]
MKKISGNKLFVKALKEESVDTIFGYPGGYNVDILDELYKQDSINVILPRHEQALIHAADGYARATGRVGVCLVTSGPGATNLVTGIATANYDSIPLVCFTGQVPRSLIGNDAFQEVDIVGITRSICKYGVTVRNRDDLGRIIKEAFYIAKTGRPGPVVIDLPKDVMCELGDTLYPESVNIRGYKPSTGVHIGQLKRAIKMLSKAQKPLFLAGGGVNIARANSVFEELVEKTQVPVVTTVMGRGAIRTNSPLYIGNMGLHGTYAANMAVSDCDLLFSIGARFNDRVTGKIMDFAPNAQIIHIDIDTASISRNVQVDVPIVADAKEACEKMLEYVETNETSKWMEKIQSWKVECPMTMQLRRGMNSQHIIEVINQEFEEAIIVTDVGQHQMWVSQFVELNSRKQLITSGGLGTMGYGFPAAIGAQVGLPEVPVICISGDGGMQMNIQEFATAVGQELPLILCVFNNYKLGMVRQMQKLFFGKRYQSTCLCARKSCIGQCGNSDYSCPPYTPDFIKLAESYGAKGIRVTETEEIQGALAEARMHLGTPTLIEFMIDSEDMVLPMVKGGSSLEDMILDC